MYISVIKLHSIAEEHNLLYIIAHENCQIIKPLSIAQPKIHFLRF